MDDDLTYFAEEIESLLFLSGLFFQDLQSGGSNVGPNTSVVGRHYT